MISSETSKNKLILKRSLIIICIALLVNIIGIFILKYQVEGEKNPPFKITSIKTFSTLDSTKNVQEVNNWDINLMQVNDIYITISRNDEYKSQEVIKAVKLDNINIVKAPALGNLIFAKLLKDDAGINRYSDEDLSNILFLGSLSTNMQNLEIGNQGGVIGLRFITKDIANYKAQEEMLSYNGDLLKRAGVLQEQISAKISFDLTMELESGLKYKATIPVFLPIGDISESGTASFEDLLLPNIALKRF